MNKYLIKTHPLLYIIMKILIIIIIYEDENKIDMKIYLHDDYTITKNNFVNYFLFEENIS